MSHIASHIRIFTPEPTDDLVGKRTTAIGEIATAIKGRRDVSELLRTANDLASAIGKGGSLSASLVEAIEGSIRKSSSSFVADGHELEMLVCGMCGALQAVTGGSALRNGHLSITDVLAFGLWSALSFQKPRSEPKFEQLRAELMKAAEDHCAAVAYKSRDRIDVGDPEFKEPAKKEGEADVPVVASAVDPGLQSFKDAIAGLRANAALDREEIDLLWWVLSDWSSLLGRRFSDEKASAASAAVASGIEAGRTMRRAPADAHRHLVLRNVRPAKEMSLQELLTAIGGDRAALAPATSTYVAQNPAVFPLLHALQTGSASDATAKIKRSLGEWAGRAFLESSIVHLCSHLPARNV